MSVDCSGARRSFLRGGVVRNRTVAEGIFELCATWEGPEPKPGQFFMVRPARGAAFLGRPISVFGWEQDDRGEAGTLRFLVALRGEGTAELADLHVGEEAELIGPLGNDWLSDAAAYAGTVPTADRPFALVGGGIGVAPVAFLAGRFPAGTYDFYAGFRSRPYGIDDLAPRTLVLATEDGCEGCRGRIPDYLEPSAYAAVFACGPEPMLEAVVEACASARVPCVVSMERRMACGVGACLGCAVPTKSGNRRCCADGPIFDAREVLFDA